MPGDDHTVVGNQHRTVEAEALDRRCDLLDLSLVMTPRVTRVGLKRSDRNVFDRGSEFSHTGTQKSRVSEPSKKEATLRLHQGSSPAQLDRFGFHGGCVHVMFFLWQSH